MKVTIFTAFCVLATTAAASYKQLTNTTGLALRDNILLPRCTGSCDACFGAGNVQCVGLTCYNPGAGEGQSIQDCAASLGVPVPTPTSSAAPSPTETDTGDSTSTPGSSDVGGDTASSSDVGNWVSHHKAIIIGAAAGLGVLILLGCCLGCWRRRRTRKVYISGANAPSGSPMVYQNDDYGSGQYVYQFAPHQNVPVTQVRYTTK
ncbi:hypothetical protein H2200_010446 [Cladophialophora chaetospira]|uniref:Uncharacterized protein n=1 Tax=Cladophialophora chaetospira TaxID=386627 RepID=A0AA38X1G2_9EURO|nr:hypothetical protein H2200_010446 [Cladophialophora chaetospira]